jgi:hypothetical protein
MFFDITTDVEAHDDYFVWKANAAETCGFSHLQKVIAALRMLAYGGPADLFDEYIRMGESTMLESVRHFMMFVQLGLLWLLLPCPFGWGMQANHSIFHHDEACTNSVYMKMKTPQYPRIFVAYPSATKVW